MNSTIDKLTRDNEALRAENESLKKQIALLQEELKTIKREFRIEYDHNVSSYRVGEIVNNHFVWDENTFSSVDRAIAHIDRTYPGSLISISCTKNTKHKNMINKNNAAQYLPFVQAMAEGKKIEIQMSHNGEWAERTSLNFDGQPESYRIKVEPPPPCDIWVNIYRGGSAYAHFSEDAAIASTNLGIIRKAVHFREVCK